jgi:hypothetical protein
MIPVSTGREVAVDIKAVKARKDMIVTRSREGVESWLEGMERCTVYRGHARFLSPLEVQVGTDRIAAHSMSAAARSFQTCLESIVSPPRPTRRFSSLTRSRAISL